MKKMLNKIIRTIKMETLHYLVTKSKIIGLSKIAIVEEIIEILTGK